MSVIFDGKKFAEEKLNLLRRKVDKLREKGIKPKLVSYTIGDNPANLLYLNLKKKAADSIGIEVEIIKLFENIKTKDLIKDIRKRNKDNNVHGIMIQLPLPQNFTKEDRDEIINAIDPQKDVDGMGDQSDFLTPVVKAVIEIVRVSSNFIPRDHETKVVVVGAKGFEGRKLYKIFKEMGYVTEGVDSKVENLAKKTKNADILISATGKEGLITKKMVKDGSILIDIGSPKGDINKDAYQKASFVSPVPKGVGPVTISSLLDNIILASGGI